MLSRRRLASSHDRGTHLCGNPSAAVRFLSMPTPVVIHKSAEQFGARELVEIAVLAEEHGLDSASVSDHFPPGRHKGGHAPFSLAWMAAVGERTTPIQLGTVTIVTTGQSCHR
jgi:alkanesulfonate monooxygenase SsuD/methylene tetrahydromethanopterin reductase-like flavin-dependent oxidoreductase (luciferase family)